MSSKHGLFLLLFMLSACNSVFYYPDSLVYLTPDKLGIVYDELKIPVKNSQEKDQPDTFLSAWRLHSKQQPANGTILHFHGNAQNMTAHFLYVAWLTEFGFDVITFDYRGYGSSASLPLKLSTREALFEDAIAALSFVQATGSGGLEGRLFVTNRPLQ